MAIRGVTVAAGVMLVGLLGACGNDGGGAVQVSPGATTPPGVPAVSTTNPTGSGSGPGTDDGTKTVIDPNGSAPGDDHTVAIGETFRVPDMIGMDVQSAQDLLQGRNSYEMEQKDATKKDRRVSKDTAWKVCTQTPAAGKYVRVDTMVRVYAVKRGEKCP